MATTRRHVLTAAASALAAQAQPPASGPVRFIRFSQGDAVQQGILNGDRINGFRGSMFGNYTSTREARPLSSVKLLYPIQPSKILAVGRNYKSHLGSTPAPVNPEIFYKPITCLIGPDEPIVIPKDAKNVHYEGELVIVMGKRARHVSKEEAKAAIFGVTCGNDVSERDWQGGPKKDLQWWRAKGADTFGPLGPAIVTGLDYGNLKLTTRVNGQVKQQQSTADLLFDCPTMVSYISRYVTLEPGDLIYTGTPGSTTAMKPGDTVEVEIENIGTLRNPITAG